MPACTAIDSYMGISARALEHVTRTCPSLSHLSYHDRLVALNLPLSLYGGQIMGMIMMYVAIRSSIVQDRLPFDDMFTILQG